MTPAEILEVGSICAPWSVGPLTRTDFVRYAGASGDFNPIHHDDEAARAAGFPQVFGMGMLSAGLLCTYATRWLGLANLRRFRARFHDQVWPGDVLTCEGTVVTVSARPCGTNEVEVSLRCVTQTGAVAVSGTAAFVRDRP